MARPRRAAGETESGLLAIARSESQYFLVCGARMRATVWPSVLRDADFGAGAFTLAVSRQPQTEDKKLRKDLKLGGPCFEGTLRSNGSPTAAGIGALNQVPWPGQLRTIDVLFEIRCRTATRVAKIARLATRLLSVNCL